jgi:hypothetical protein
LNWLCRSSQEQLKRKEHFHTACNGKVFIWRSFYIVGGEKMAAPEKPSNKRLFGLAVASVLALAAGVYAYTQSIPNPGHGADAVWVSVGSAEKTLQQAIDDGSLKGSTKTVTVVTRVYVDYSSCYKAGCSGYSYTGCGSGYVAVGRYCNESCPGNCGTAIKCCRLRTDKQTISYLA